MTSPTLTSTYNYDNSAKRWRNSNDGRFVSQDIVVGEMRRHQEATYSTLEDLTRRLYSNGSDRINVAQWQAGIALELKDAHLAQAMFGAGGRANMSFVEWGRVGQTLKEQYAFLDNFARQIAAGQISEKQALARIRQYGNVTQQSYWNEVVVRSNDGASIFWDVFPGESCNGCLGKAAGSPYTKETVPGVPGDGDTPCRGNCRCRLRIEYAAV